MDPLDLLGYAASLTVLATFCMRTMIPLRIIAICSNVLFAGYGFFDHLYPVLFLHLLLFPVNLGRLIQIQRLVKGLRSAQKGNISINSLLPFMSSRALRSGEILIHKGDRADRLFYLVQGKMEVKEHKKIVGPGTILGEIGIFAPNKKRTATVVSRTDTVVYELTEVTAKQLYFQNPAFGFAVLQLIIRRLLENQDSKAILAAKDRMPPPRIGRGRRIWARVKSGKIGRAKNESGGRRVQR